MIEIKVGGSVVSVQETVLLYSGSAGTHICHFTFDAGWDNFRKSAVFRVGGRAVTAFIDEESCCVLPWELLTRANIGLRIEVGVYGVSTAAEVLTTVWDSIGTVRDGSELGNDAREPGEGVYDQIMAGIQRIDEKVVSYNEQAQAQAQQAESAAKLSSESAAAASRSVEAAETAAANANNAKTAAQNALAGVQAALDNLPAGDTLIINDLTTGGTSAALSAEMGKTLAQRPNPNLLHNWYFANAVNQRGSATYTASGYTVDRWKLSGTELAMTIGDGLTLNHTNGTHTRITQRIENAEQLAGRVVHLSVMASGSTKMYALLFYNGATSGTGMSGKALNDTITVYSTSITLPEDLTTLDLGIGVLTNYDTGTVTVYAAKLELGSAQTLAHQDRSGNWVLNEIPDFGEELRKCQRYFQVVNKYGNGSAHLLDVRGETAATALGTLSLPVPMRAVPNVSVSGVAPQVWISGESYLGLVDVSGIEVSDGNCDAERLQLLLSIDSSRVEFTPGTWYGIIAGQTGNIGQTTQIYLDANL